RPRPGVTARRGKGVGRKRCRDDADLILGAEKVSGRPDPFFDMTAYPRSRAARRIRCLSNQQTRISAISVPQTKTTRPAENWAGLALIDKPAIPQSIHSGPHALRA